MRSLLVKITLAFALVSLVGMVLAAIIIHQRTRVAFDRFLVDQDRSNLISALVDYYESTGTWEQVKQVFQQYPGWRGGNTEGSHPENRPREDLFRTPYVLADAHGNIVYGRTADISKPLTQKDLEGGVALEVNGDTVGWLLLSPPPLPPPERDRNAPQTVFLRNFNQVIFVSAVSALILALIIGIIVARSLTSPLRELAAASNRIAKGELGYKVQVRSKDEIGQLADSFNQMSTDLAKSTQLRKQMTADIAHDLRTPLSVLMGYTEALSDGKIRATPEIYNTMRDMALHLNHLVDDLRTISLADAGELPINLQETPPGILLERASATYSSQAQEKQVSLHVKVEPGLPLIRVDAERMAQVLGNLVSNALRYAKEGGWIELSVQLDNNTVKINVSDNGSGIAEEDLPNIFTRFYRGDKARQGNGEAGLGLSIARSLVEAQGGKITVESKLGLGTTFTMLFPVV